MSDIRSATVATALVYICLYFVYTKCCNSVYLEVLCLGYTFFFGCDKKFESCPILSLAAFHSLLVRSVLRLLPILYSTFSSHLDLLYESRFLSAKTLSAKKTYFVVFFFGENRVLCERAELS